MANDYVDFLDQQPASSDAEDLKKSSLYQSNQRLRIENISSQSDVHGGGSNILIKEEHHDVESPNLQLPESADGKSQDLLRTGEIPVSNPSLPDNFQDHVQITSDRGATQSPDTHIPGRTIRGLDDKPADIVVKQNSFQGQIHTVEPTSTHKQEVFTQVKEVAVDIYQSPSISIFGPTAVNTQEDTSFGLSLSYTYSSKLPITGIEAIIRGLPTYFVITKTIGVLTTILVTEPDGSYHIDVNDLAYININPPANYSGETTFQAYITGTTQDGVVLVSPSLPITTTVIAVADQPVATSANITGTEDITTGLNNSFTATSPDAIGVGLYGSEVISAKLDGIPANIKLYYEGSSGTYLSQDSSGNWIVDPARLSLVRFETPENYKGIFTVTYEVTSTEPSNGDSKSISQTFDVTINPVADGIGGYISTNLSGSENTIISSSPSSHAIELVLSDPSETIHVSLSGISSGATIQGYDGTSYNSTTSTGTVDISSWGRIVVESGVTKWILDQINVTPKTYSDVDLDLQISAFTTDSGAGQTVTSPPITFDIPVTVLAVAQPAQVSPLSNIVINTNGSWTYSFTEDQGASKIAAFHVALTDTDGSEILTTNISDIPTGTIIIQTDSLGNTLASSDGVQTSFTLNIPMNGDIYLKVISPTNSSDDFVLNLNVQTQETNPDNSQVDVRYNTTVIPIDVIIAAKADLAAITVSVDNVDHSSNFATTINEHIPTETYTPVTFSFTANSTDLVDSTDTNAGPETITSITLTGLAMGTVIESSYINGGTYTVITSGDIISFDLPPGQTSISGTYTITPPLFYESSISALLSVTTTEPTNGDSITSTITQTIGIDPVATTPIISVQPTYIINEDPAANSPYQSITFNTNDITTDDLHVTLSGLEPGSVIRSVANSAIMLTVAADGTVTLTDQNWPDLYSTPGHLTDSGTISFRITPPENYSSTSPSTITVTATAFDGTDTASTTSSFEFSVNPVADLLNNPTATTTNIVEPASYSNLTLTLPLTDIDGSESITSATLQGVPDGYEIKVQDTFGGWHNATLVPDGAGYNSASLLDFGNLIGDNIYVQIYPVDTAKGDVLLTALIVNTDTGVTTDTHSTIVPITFNIEQVLDGAIATPTLATGNEDSYIQLDLGLTISDPTEYFSHLTISNIPAGGGIYIENTPSVFTPVTGGDLVAAGWTTNSHVYYLPPTNDNTSANLSVDYQVTEPYGPNGAIQSTLDHNTIGVTVYGQADTPTITADNVNYFADTSTSLGLSFTTTDNDGSEHYSFTLAVTGSGADWLLTDGSNTISPSTSSTSGADTTNTYIFSGANAVSTLESLHLDPNTTGGTFSFNLITTVTENDYATYNQPGGEAQFTNSFTADQISARMASPSSSSEDVILDINHYITNINNSDFVTITGFTSNTDFYSVDSGGHETLLGMTGADGSIILNGSQVNGSSGHELYYDNMGGHNTIDMSVNINQGNTYEVYTFHVDQHTGVLSDPVMVH